MPETPDWAAPQQAQPNLFQPGDFDASEAGSSSTATLASAGHTVRVVGVQLVPAVSPPVGAELRGVVVLILTDPDDSDAELARLAISPAAPYARQDWPAGGGYVTAGRRVSLTRYTLPGGGSQTITPAVWWHEV